MSNNIPLVSKTLLSEVTASGSLKLTLADVPVRKPLAGEILVQLSASPINPSDIGLMLAAADLETLKKIKSDSVVGVEAKQRVAAMPGLKGRWDIPLLIGYEGSGTIVAASKGDGHLVGKKVAVSGKGTYAQYITLPTSSCIFLNDSHTMIEAASAFINPLTALGFVETMKSEGHKAMILTAAGSNLAQMMNRLAEAGGFDIVNIVRRSDQAAALRQSGLKYVCDSSADNYREVLTDYIAVTGATLAFDALGGGDTVDVLLSCMESAINRQSTEYNRYGSSVHKQVYIYGGLVGAPTTLGRNYGFAWGVSTWLLFNFLNTLSKKEISALNIRVKDNLTTIFASVYNHEISLEDLLNPEIIRNLRKNASGDKYIIVQ